MMRFPRFRVLLPAAALLLGLGTATARAQSFLGSEYTQFIAVWLQPGLGLVEAEAPSLLTLPPGWIIGDAVAVLTPGDDWPPRERNRLVAKLLESGAGVLDISGRGAAHLGDDLAAALRVAHGDHGAGLTVVIGRGATGDAVLSVAAQATTPDGQRYVAAVRLGPGGPGVVFAAAMESEDWPMRAGLLCELLIAARPGDEAALEAACLSGLAVLR